MYPVIGVQYPIHELLMGIIGMVQIYKLHAALLSHLALCLHIVLQIPAPEIVGLRDSIVGQYRDETSIPMLIAQMLDVKVANGAFGGTTMSLQNRDWRDAYYWDGLSCTQLTRAVAAQDFGLSVTPWVLTNQQYVGLIKIIRSCG